MIELQVALNMCIVALGLLASICLGIGVGMRLDKKRGWQWWAWLGVVTYAIMFFLAF